METSRRAITTILITLDFASPIFGAGTQIQTDFYGDCSGTVTAFDSSNLALTSFGFNGTSGMAEENSALFVGVLSDSPNIFRIVYQIDSASSDPTDFAVNRVDLVAAPEMPEPCTLALLAAGGAPLLLALRRKRLQR